MTNKKKKKRTVKYYLKKVFGSLSLIIGVNSIFRQLFGMNGGSLWAQTPEAKVIGLFMGAIFIIGGLQWLTEGEWWHQK